MLPVEAFTTVACADGIVGSCLVIDNELPLIVARKHEEQGWVDGDCSGLSKGLSPGRGLILMTSVKTISTSSARNANGIVRNTPNTKANNFVFITVIILVKQCDLFDAAKLLQLNMPTKYFYGQITMVKMLIDRQINTLANGQMKIRYPLTAILMRNWRRFLALVPNFLATRTLNLPIPLGA